MILMIDNYDSFTYNLVQYLSELGEKVVVYRNDQITIPAIKQMRPTRIVISPGPGTPRDAGISNAVIQALSGTLPILGVCLGHQCIGQVFGGKIVRAKRIMHGKVSPVQHDKKKLFRGIQNPMTATRYHSLLIENRTFPKVLKITAKTKQNEIMALEHRTHPTYGVQFHPESIMSPDGKKLLKNFISMVRK
jgi:anthranilate synthase/aminodeoxychorismate synthase-like glutamine amidotransferase